MAGGSGTRFWPWSREDRPKQLLALASSRSMLADTVSRLKGLVPCEQVFLVVGEKHRRQVLRELPDIPVANVLAEPVGRNTAPCIGWAADEVRARCPDAVTAVLSADHRIGPDAAFRRDLARAFAVADRERCLVTFGIRPSGPSTAYGYIRATARRSATAPAVPVEAFVEKPTLPVARRYVASGRYWWNSGLFVWRADAIREEIREHLPALDRGLRRLEASRRGGSIPRRTLRAAWPKLPSISIDHGVLEHSGRVRMLAATFDWADVGSWDAMPVLWGRDRSGNSTRDPLLALDSCGNVVASNGKPVVLLGVKDLVVVDAGDALLVCDRARCQDIRGAVAGLEAAGLGRLR